MAIMLLSSRPDAVPKAKAMAVTLIAFLQSRRRERGRIGFEAGPDATPPKPRWRASPLACSFSPSLHKALLSAESEQPGETREQPGR